jgi:arsenite methyltransferase
MSRESDRSARCIRSMTSPGASTTAQPQSLDLHTPGTMGRKGPSMQEYLSFQFDFADEKAVSVYDELPLWSAMFGLLLLKNVEMRPNMRVLDVGCGTGFPLIELAQRLGPTCSVYGIDPWEPGVKRAEARMGIRGVRNAHVRIGDASSLPFNNHEFDLIVSNLGINNFEDPDAVFAECRRVLTPSGTLSLTTNLVGHMKEFYEVFEATLRKTGNAKALDSLQKHIDHRATIQKVDSMLFRNGFRISRVVEENGSMRFTNGTALLNHYFIKLGFLDGWKMVLEPDRQEHVFSLLEDSLNGIAARQGCLDLTIPMAYIEARTIT